MPLLFWRIHTFSHFPPPEENSSNKYVYLPTNNRVLSWLWWNLGYEFETDCRETWLIWICCICLSLIPSHPVALLFLYKLSYLSSWGWTHFGVCIYYSVYFAFLNMITSNRRRALHITGVERFHFNVFASSHYSSYRFTGWLLTWVKHIAGGDEKLVSLSQVVICHFDWLPTVKGFVWYEPVRRQMSGRGEGWTRESGVLLEA